MVRIEEKTIDDFIAVVSDALQNSLITTTYSFTYRVGQTNYTLPGFATNNPRIYSIEGIEGVGYSPEDYITENDIDEGVEYSLWDDYSTPEYVGDNYGIASGVQVYSGITIADQTFKDGSTIFVKYKYQNTNYVPVLTNFSQNSMLRKLLTSVILNVQQTNNQVANSIKAFGIESYGDDLTRIASLVNLTPYSAVKTTGQVKVSNSDVNDYVVTTSHRFATISGGSYIAFKPLIATSIPAGSFAYVDVEAVDSGSKFNVGSYSISVGFTDTDLTVQVPSTITLTNPPIGDVGQDNYFNNGADEETDESFQSRVKLAFSQSKTASYSTLEKAAEDTNLIHSALVYDTSNRKGFNPNEIEIVVSTKTGNILSDTSLSQIVDAMNTVKPSGSILTVKQSMNTYINFVVDVFVDVSTLSDTSQLDTDIKKSIDDFINAKEIGEDILPSSIISIIRGFGDVLDVDIVSSTVTEYVSEVNSLDSRVYIDNAGTETTMIALEVPFNSATSKTETQVHSAGAANGTYTVLNSPIDSRVSPRVNRAVTGYDGLKRPSALNITDYWLSNTTTVITYDYNKEPSYPIVNSDELIFDYNYYDNLLLDGFRVRLGGTSGDVVALDFGYTDGSDPIYTGGSVNFTSVATATVTLNGTEKYYDFNFSSQQTVAPQTNKYWIILKKSSGTANSYLPVNTSNPFVHYNPKILEDTSSPFGNAFTSVNKRAMYHSFTKFTGANVNKKLKIPSVSDEVEKPVAYTHTLNFKLFEES
jgi:phage-related baseplate assembly protein